jgi:diketogulonate reductase-like aldo/keto reductase
MSTPLMRIIPSSGEAIPAVGMGTWQSFDIDLDSPAREDLGEVCRTFVDMGGRLVDSSPMYGRSEAVVGSLSAELDIHQQFFLATKVWTRGRNNGIRQMEDSMRKLRVSRLDLMQVHNLVDVEVHLETLREWKQQGRVRYIGVTHYMAAAHDAVAAILEAHQVDFVQINYSAAEREVERRVLPIAQDRGVAVLANRPFAEGTIFRRIRPRPLPAWAGEIDCRSWAEALLKFVVSHPAVTCAIPATSDVAHLRENMRAAYGPLPDAKLRERIAGDLL